MHGIYSGTLLSIVVPDKRRTLSNARFYSNLVSCPRIRILSLRSKWADGKARGGRISRAIRNRRATQPPAHFHRNPPGRGQLAVFPRCSLLTYRFRYDRRSRLEKQPTDLRRKACLFRGQDTSLAEPVSFAFARTARKAIRALRMHDPRNCDQRRGIPCNGDGPLLFRSFQSLTCSIQPARSDLLLRERPISECL